MTKLVASAGAVVKNITKMVAFAEAVGAKRIMMMACVGAVAATMTMLVAFTWRLCLFVHFPRRVDTSFRWYRYLAPK